ncbi:hypothetical protein [Flavobacterium oreochromis]|uniref:Uncharacterized protein n=1 Tax=Flavobacterium oreochromis TaxID=2906078 RepID=A0ABW8P716_9FLAO
MVATIGGNYVGTPEPQLREKLGELYVMITNSFNAPSFSQMENLESIKFSFDTLQKEINLIENKDFLILKKKAEKNHIPYISKSFDEFIKDL